MFSVNVFADTDSYMRSYVNDGSGLLLCEYAGSDGTIQSRIYFKFAILSAPTQIEFWGAYYKDWDTNTLITLNYEGLFASQGAMSFGQYSALATASRISYQEDGKRLSLPESQFVCPRNFFIDRTRLNELCYADYDYCGDEYEEGPYSLTDNEETIFNIINKYASETVYDNITFDEWRNNDLLDLVKSKTLTYITDKYSLGTTYKMPDFIKNYIENISNYIDTINHDSNYNKFNEKMESQTKEAADSGIITEEEEEELLEKASKSMSEALGAFAGYPVDPNPNPNCSGLLGEQMTKIVNNLFKFVRYLGPALVSALTIMDFIKVVASGDQEMMKKASNKFIKRLICAILLFFVPILCKALFSITGITVPETCIK